MIRALLMAAVFGVPISAFAQSNVGARGYLSYGQTSPTAKDSFETVGASAKQNGLGGGGSVTGLWKGLFVDVAITQQKMTGERVFLDGATVYRLGIPLRITVRPVDVAAGWRLVRGRMSPYIGGGISFMSYKERDDFAQAGDEVNEQASGGVIVGGADVSILRWVHLGGEVRYRMVSGILGAGGVSHMLGDDQLGGLSLAARISVGR